MEEEFCERYNKALNTLKQNEIVRSEVLKSCRIPLVKNAQEIVLSSRSDLKNDETNEDIYEPRKPEELAYI